MFAINNLFELARGDRLVDPTHPDKTHHSSIAKSPVNQTFQGYADDLVNVKNGRDCTRYQKPPPVMSALEGTVVTALFAIAIIGSE